MMAIYPEMKPVPKGAGFEVRKQMYLDYVTEMVALNPGRFLPLGVRRRWWNFKLEHPLTHPHTKLTANAQAHLTPEQAKPAEGTLPAQPVKRSGAAPLLDDGEVNSK